MPEQPEYLDQVEACLEKCRHVMLVDPRQVARTAVEDLVGKLDNVIRIRNMGFRKDELITLAFQLYEEGWLQGMEIESGKTLAEFKKALGAGKTLADIADLVAASLASHSCTLVLDEPSVTRSKLKLVEKIAESATILAIVKNESQIADASALFQIIEVPRDVQADLKTLIWSQLDRKQVEDPEFLESRLRFLSGRSSEHLATLASRLQGLSKVTVDDIRKLQAPKGAWMKVDLSPLIILIAAAFVGIRALGLGQNSSEMYMIGLMGGAVCWALYRLLSRGRMEEE